MKLNDFKAFELGKAQMNAIAGGVKEFYCTGDNHQRATIMVDTLEQAQAAYIYTLLRK